MVPKARAASHTFRGTAGSGRWRLGRRAAAGLVGLVTVAVLSVPSTYGAPAPTKSCTTCLGKLTNDIPNRYVPIGSYVRMPVNLHSGHRTDVVLIDTSQDGNSAALRWPLVKALLQFGRFTHIKPTAQDCEGPYYSKCLAPSFDLAHARYASPYFSLQERDLLDQDDHVHLKRLTSLEKRVYDKYGRPPGKGSSQEKIQEALSGFSQDGTVSQHLPLLAIGNRLDEDQLTYATDFKVDYLQPVPPSSNPWPVVTFSFAQHALASGHAPKNTTTRQYSVTLLYDVNAETNLLIAMFCRADHGKPKKACDRAVVKRIDKHLK